MEKTLILYPAVFQMLLTLYLYVKNYLDNTKATKDRSVKFGYFKAYQGDVPEYIHVSRQTLKNQFELPILFYFLISLIISFDVVTMIDLVLAWVFVVSRYIHCFIRLTSNYVPYRAPLFIIGLLTLIAGWVYFLLSIF